MGSSISHAAAPPPPPPAYGAFVPSTGADPAAPPKPHEDAEKEAAEEKVDSLNLLCRVPYPYGEIHSEAFSVLKPELFEGLRFEVTELRSSGFTPYFALSHRISIGTSDLHLPSHGHEVVKVPFSSHEFRANFLDPKMMLIGRLSHDGWMTTRANCNITDNLTLGINSQLTNVPQYSQHMITLDYKGKGFRSQVQLGNNAFYGGNYLQSVRKNLLLGTEAFWAGNQRIGGFGFAACYDTENIIATGQIATTGLVALSYVQKVSEKVSLASDFTYNQMTKDVSASFGCDCTMQLCRLRGKLDSNGIVSTLLEERLTSGVNLLLSAEIDHSHKNYQFGFGVTIGE